MVKCGSSSNVLKRLLLPHSLDPMSKLCQKVKIFIIFNLNGFSTDESVRPLYVLLENSDAATHLTTFAYIPESRTLYYITADRQGGAPSLRVTCTLF